MLNKICILGSGNWGSAIAKVIGNNIDNFDNDLESNEKYEINMWVYEEIIEGKKLSEIINHTHRNIKYLPDIDLPNNVFAEPDLIKAVTNANILVFVLPHQFLPKIINTIKNIVTKDTIAISLIKGVHFENDKIILISDIIRKGLNIDVSVLMGANIANDVAKNQFCETTIGYTNLNNAKIFKSLFNTSYFRVSLIEDSIGVELCGALKNIVALGAGFCDGLDLGSNTKAAIIRIGLGEMKLFCKTYYAGIKDQTFLESCGIADLITTCFGGRNRKCAEEFARNDGKISWEEIEEKMLNGQKLQGTLTLKEIYPILVNSNNLDNFPLFNTIYRICFENKENISSSIFGVNKITHIYSNL